MNATQAPKAIWFALGVALIAFVAHIPSLSAGFVYDDHRFIERNPAIRSIDPVAFFTEAESTSASAGIQPDIYRPLRTLLFSLEFALFGLDPLGWHAVSVLLHMLNAVLLLLLLRRYLGGRGLPAAIGAALFAAHPMTSESVAWVSSQGDLLAVSFMLTALWILREGGMRRTCIGSGVFVLACLSKESALVLPALVFLQDLILRRGAHARAPTWRDTWTRLGFMAVLIGGYFWARLAVVPTVRQIPYPGGFDGTARGMFEGLSWYTLMLVWPRGFPFDLQYEPPLSWGEPMVVFGIGIFLTLLLAGFHGWRSGRARMAFVALGVLACLVPVSNVIVPLKAFIADRFLYPALCCLALGAALLAVEALRVWRPVVPYVAGGLVVALAVLTMGRDRSYADEMTLWKAVRADRPTNANAYQGMAWELARRAEIADAERAFRTYIAFNPIDGKAWMVLGDTFASLAGSLDPNAPIAEGSNMALRQKQARAAQISAYREAFRIWSSFGLGVGRGSPRMQAGMLDRWFVAAANLGDIAEMRRVNHTAVQVIEGLDPGDSKVFWAQASWRARARRFAIAMRALGKNVTSVSVPREQLEQVLRERALVLRDVRLDPNRSDEALRLPFARLVEAETHKAVDAGESVSAADFGTTVVVLLGRGDKPAAVRLLKRGLEQHPKASGLLRLLDRLSP